MSRLQERLPTREQIQAVTDVEALEGLRHDVALAAEHIATDLEFRADDEEWAIRARNALSLHRHVGRMLSRRIGVLREAEEAEERREACTRPDEDCDPLTLEVLQAAPTIDADALKTVSEIDERLAWLQDRIVAVQHDRADETARDMEDYDHGFLKATKNVLRLMNILRSQLEARRRHLVKVARVAKEAARECSREETFIQVCRERLSRETFVGFWAEVDARLEAKAAA